MNCGALKDENGVSLPKLYAGESTGRKFVEKVEILNTCFLSHRKAQHDLFRKFLNWLKTAFFFLFYLWICKIIQLIFISWGKTIMGSTDRFREILAPKISKSAMVLFVAFLAPKHGVWRNFWFKAKLWYPHANWFGYSI